MLYRSRYGSLSHCPRHRLPRILILAMEKATTQEATMIDKDGPEINRVIEAMIDAHRSTGASLRDVADTVLDRYGYSPSRDAVRALAAIDEAAQLARGELGEAAMKNGEAKDASIARADRILADGIRQANDALAQEVRV